MWPFVFVTQFTKITLEYLNETPIIATSTTQTEIADMTQVSLMDSNQYKQRKAGHMITLIESGIVPHAAETVAHFRAYRECQELIEQEQLVDRTTKFTVEY